MMQKLDPVITVKEALEKTGGNQAALGRILGISRVSVNEWVSSGRVYIPKLQAHRFVRLYGDSSSSAHVEGE